ncbi:MAG: hypothetical protein E7388_00700 [Ruminococcaceae bacterium]|nr:hypothetical protein [Oscillospiraceae bacterium]
MIYLILAVLCSVLISVIMRLSTDKVKNNISMLAMNYVMCIFIALLFSGIGNVLTYSNEVFKTIWFGIVNGIFYLMGFVLFQYNVKKNGVVLSSVFMRLGLLVPLIISLLVFQEIPGIIQILGSLLAVVSIIILNLNKKQKLSKSSYLLLFLLLASGAGDAMSKIYEEYGTEELASQFLLYTFFVALLLCIIFAVIKKQKFGKNEIVFGLLIGIPNFFSAKFLLMSLKTVPGIVAYPTYSIATLLIVTLVGVFYFKEKLSPIQWVAVVGIFIAIGLLNI